MTPAPQEPAQFIQRGNVTADQICANIRANAGRDLPTVEFGKICICASGPSLADHLGQIRQRVEQGWRVAAMNGSYKFLVEHGIRPDLFFMVDAREGINLPFVTGPHVNLGTRHVIASQCHPEIFEALQGYRVLLWQVSGYSGAVKAINDARGTTAGAIFMGAINVGQSCMNALYAMGYNNWALFGFDGSVRWNAQDANDPHIHRHAFDQPQNADEPVLPYTFPLGHDNERLPETRDYWATPTMAHAATMMPDRISHFRRHGVRIEVIGDGLLPHMVAVNAIPDTETTQSGNRELAEMTIPAAKPRRPNPKNTLPIVAFKWNGHIPYTTEDVRIWAHQVASNMQRTEIELVCITDEPEELRTEAAWSGLRVLPMWRDEYEHGRDWHRLKLFAEEMADVIGPRFVVMDLDTVICGPIDDLFATDAPYKAWQDPSRDQYCTALQIMDAGAFPHVWDWFKERDGRGVALRLRKQGVFGGYDQAWISQVLPGQPRWTRDDGVISFRRDVLQGVSLEAARDNALARHWMERGPNENVKIINFHGKYKPRDPEVRAAFPWIKDFYR